MSERIGNEDYIRAIGFTRGDDYDYSSPISYSGNTAEGNQVESTWDDNTDMYLW
jgi:hypothetical protein